MARAYLAALYPKLEEHVAILALDRISKRHPEQRIVLVDKLLDGNYMSWLRHLNARGYDIFVSVNPIDPERKKRTEDDVASIRRLQLDLDDNGSTGLHAVLADVHRKHLPRPAATVRTSPSRYQVLWHADSEQWTADQAKGTMRQLAAAYGGDSSVADVARVMRLPGFRNKKRDRHNTLVKWTDYAGSATAPADFERLPAVDRPGDRERSTAADEPTPPASGPGDDSRSGQDWGWAKDQLSAGVPPALVEAALEERRPDKQNPQDYARR